jgi:hypothetical protein
MHWEWSAAKAETHISMHGNTISTINPHADVYEHPLLTTSPCGVFPSCLVLTVLRIRRLRVPRAQGAHAFLLECTHVGTGGRGALG